MTELTEERIREIIREELNARRVEITLAKGPSLTGDHIGNSRYIKTYVDSAIHERESRRL